MMLQNPYQPLLQNLIYLTHQIPMKTFQVILSLSIFLIFQSVVETKELVCETSNDKRKKICYFSSSQSCAEFHSCQQTICIANGNGGCKQTTFELSEEQCLIQVCDFNPYEGDLQQCISKFRKTQNDLTSTIESVIITGLIIFIMVSIILQIKNCLCPGDYSPQDEQSGENSEGDQLQGQGEGFMEVNSEENIVQMSQTQKQRRRRERFMKRHKIDQPQFDLNLGFINEESSPLKETIEIQNQVCCICLNSASINTQTACGHFYHSKCLLGWLKVRQFCPSCRSTNFYPVKLFCTNCKKIRDIFRISKKNYLGFSGISGEYFNRFDSCNECIDRIYESQSQPNIHEREQNR